MLYSLQGLFPPALSLATSQEGLTGSIDFKVQIVGPDLDWPLLTPLSMLYF